MEKQENGNLEKRGKKGIPEKERKRNKKEFGGKERKNYIEGQKMKN